MKGNKYNKPKETICKVCGDSSDEINEDGLCPDCYDSYLLKDRI